MSHSKLHKESTPIWFNIRKPIEFDESTARTRFLQNPPVTGNVIASLNANGEIRFEYIPSSDQIIHLADKNTCIRMRGTFYPSNTVNGTWQGNQGLYPTTGVPNRNADITLESAFFGYLFNRVELYLGQTTPVDLIQYFPIWFQLMCHIQPLEFKQAIGDQIGYFPDENSGLAVGSTFSYPYLLLANTTAGGLNAGTNGTAFAIVATITNSTANPINAGAVIPYTIYGTSISINLVANVAIAANTTVTQCLQLACPYAVAGAGSYQYSIPGATITFITIGAAAVNAPVFIVLANTTSTALTTSTLGTYPVNGSTIQLPILAPFSNLNYEPGYFKRSQIFNGIAQSADAQGRQFEIMVPLYYMFGFCHMFNRLTSNLSFQIKLVRETTTNPFIGYPGTDAFFAINEMYLQIMQIVPEDEMKVHFNKAIELPVEIGYITPLIQSFPVSGTQINYVVPAGSYKPEYVFIIFKDATKTVSSQFNASLNSNADILSLQVNLGGELYPVNAQDAHWNVSGTEGRMVGINRFYEQFRDCCVKITGQCSMTFKQFRDLYPIFAFDLTAQNIKVRNQATQVNIIGTRNSNTPVPIAGIAGSVSVNMYVVVLYEKFFEAKYLRNEILPKSEPSNMEMHTGSGLFIN